MSMCVGRGGGVSVKAQKRLQLLYVVYKSDDKIAVFCHNGVWKSGRKEWR